MWCLGDTDDSVLATGLGEVQWECVSGIWDVVPNATADVLSSVGGCLEFAVKSQFSFSIDLIIFCTEIHAGRLQWEAWKPSLLQVCLWAPECCEFELEYPGPGSCPCRGNLEPFSIGSLPCSTIMVGVASGCTTFGASWDLYKHRERNKSIFLNPS